MAKGKNKAKARMAALVLAAERVGPTPQTLAKAKPCPIRRMHAAGQITDAQRDAALEIVLVIDAIAGRLKASGLRERGSGEISDKLAEIHKQRYLPWTRSIGPACAAVVHDVAVGGLLPEEVVARRRLDWVEVIEHVQAGLESYVVAQLRTPQLDIRSLKAY